MPFDIADYHRDWHLELQDEIIRWKAFLLQNPKAMATIDFETRSACDLKKYGSWVYSKHHSTQAMCLAFHLPDCDEDDIGLWNGPSPGVEESELPLELFAFVLAGGTVEAHNAFFERVIWLNVMVARHGWPEMPHEAWRCSASRASACALPRDLEGAGKAMGLGTEKDKEGWRLMLKMSKPRKPRKAEIEEWMAKEGLTGDYRRQKKKFIEANPPLWHEDPADIERQWAYCKQDVKTEHALSQALPELSEKELKLWQLDQRTNERGAKFDRGFAEVALGLADKWKAVLNRELFEITGISRATQRQQVKDWLEENENLELPDTTADTLDWYLDGKAEASDRALRVLEIVKQVNRTSIRKYTAALDKTDEDDWRARDLLMYHGANTGRWSGKGIQVQNFPRGTIEDMDAAVADIMEGDLDWLEACYGDVMELLSSALRGLLVPREGHDLIVADYSAIEARCVLWEADAQDALQVFRTGGDIYCDMATGIYGFEVNKKDHKDERQFGKQAILGLGYGMGFITFLLTCRRYKISFGLKQVQGILKDRFDKYNDWVNNYLFPERKEGEELKKFRNRERQASKVRRQLIDAGENPKKIIHELALMKYTVDVYRQRYGAVKQMWADQEEAAISAIRQWQDNLDAVFDLEDEFTQQCLKPRGDEHFMEDLRTPFGVAWRDKIDGPAVRSGKIIWQVVGGFLCCTLPSGRKLRYRDPYLKVAKTSWGAMKEGIRYYTVITGGKWARTSTYGGKIVENITQAVARDIMADAMLRMDGSIYIPLITVHDEQVSEVPTGQGDVAEFEELMAEIEPWAEGCPVAAEGEIMARYRK